jgi:transcriptional regulator of acetoin/glycerol metabolism
MQYNWPGNIRELEHLIERSIIISKDTSITFGNLLNASLNKSEQDITAFKTLEEIEKDHIITALKISHGKVTGEKSAAQLLGINGKTLASRMRKLGIKRTIEIHSA